MKDIPFSERDIARFKELAQTDAGKELLRYLQKNQGSALQSALQGAETGDYTQAKQLARSLLSSPEARALLRQLGR